MPTNLGGYHLYQAIQEHGTGFGRLTMEQRLHALPTCMDLGGLRSGRHQHWTWEGRKQLCSGVPMSPVIDRRMYTPGDRTST